MFQPGEKIPVKFSGDGAKFSRTSNMMILSFSIIVPQGRYELVSVLCVCVYVCVCACVCMERVERLENLTCSTYTYITQYCLFDDLTHVHEDAR